MEEGWPQEMERGVPTEPLALAYPVNISELPVVTCLELAQWEKNTYTGHDSLALSFSDILYSHTRQESNVPCGHRF